MGVAMYWEEEKECMNREDMEQLQLERLQSTIYRVATHVPFYRKRFKEINLDPDGFRSLEELSGLPFTVKDDLRDNYPYGLFAVPLRDVVRIHSSSGTTGMATVVGPVLRSPGALQGVTRPVDEGQTDRTAIQPRFLAG